MILLTRPEGASRGTEARLVAAGFDVLVDPLLVLRFAPPAHLIGDPPPGTVVITSSNGARAIANHADLAALVKCPVWTIGTRTTAAVRELGFTELRFEAPDVAHLAAELSHLPPQTLLYLAAENRAAELSELLPMHRVETKVVYSAVPKSALAAETVAALREGRISDVLHYSRRLAEYYLALADAAGIGREALVPRQLCLSEQVAAALRAAGAPDIRVATAPREDALLGLLAG